MRKMREDLLFELGPIASGYDGHFDDTQKAVQARRHYTVEGRLTFDECAVQIEDNQLFHCSAPG